MKESDFETAGTWRSVADGQVYEAVAKTKATKRVISRATGHIALGTMDDLEREYGPAGRTAIETSVNDTCKQLALKFPG